MTKVKKELEDNFQKVTKKFPATRFLAIAFILLAEFINDKLWSIATEIANITRVITTPAPQIH